MLMVLFDADDDAERATMQAALSALQAIGTAGASIAGASILAGLGSDHHAYVWLFVISAAARLAAALLLVRQLPIALAQFPISFVARAWTLAIRPWGGTIVRPIVDGIDRLRGRDRNRRD
jgi:MFS family permease